MAADAKKVATVEPRSISARLADNHQEILGLKKLVASQATQIRAMETQIGLLQAKLGE